jgi:hypothetical protein
MVYGIKARMKGRASTPGGWGKKMVDSFIVEIGRCAMQRRPNGEEMRLMPGIPDDRQKYPPRANTAVAGIVWDASREAEIRLQIIGSW